MGDFWVGEEMSDLSDLRVGLGDFWVDLPDFGLRLSLFGRIMAELGGMGVGWIVGFCLLFGVCYYVVLP